MVGHQLAVHMVGHLLLALQEEFRYAKGFKNVRNKLLTSSLANVSK